MKTKFIVMFVSAFMMMICGCSTANYDLNFQRSNIRSTGDLSVTAVLHNRKASEVETYRAEIIDLCDRVNKFLDDGSLGDLTGAEFTKKLISMIPVKYQFVADQVIALVATWNVDATKIGTDNVLRIKALFVGAKIAAIEFRYIEPVVTTTTTTVLTNDGSNVATTVTTKSVKSVR